MFFEVFSFSGLQVEPRVRKRSDVRQKCFDEGMKFILKKSQRSVDVTQNHQQSPTKASRRGEGENYGRARPSPPGPPTASPAPQPRPLEKRAATRDRVAMGQGSGPPHELQVSLKKGENELKANSHAAAWGPEPIRGARISLCSLPDPAACGVASVCPPIWQILNIWMPINVCMGKSKV